eukprot:CAMPEP_0118633280 /NCGR_PEP_ID=MMETSP0785-20121206/909_1 /TAXON_ID=91992 /ORGANISM="Bolidomonas pacifica, Strain CCMP 1866" /LENGTH=442 /DNA_ID=CAMNT_0006524137 /DNA_START=95 /DNA_END=1420 /DNA_ORIENTATION=+
MSLFAKFRAKRGKGGDSIPGRLTPREDMRPFTSKFRPTGKGMKDEKSMKAIFKRADVYNLMAPADPFPEVPGRMPRDVACWRLRRIDVTVGQQWILRIKFTYRFVTTYGETMELSYAAPEDEVKPTTFMKWGGGVKLSSVDVNFILQGDEILTGIQGKVHTTEQLYTDIIFETNKGRKFVCQSAARTNSSVHKVEIDTYLLQNVSFTYGAPKNKFGRRRESEDEDGQTGILGLKVGIVQNSRNMFGVGAISCIVTKFVGVDDEVCPEWTDKEMEKIKAIEQMKKARELEMLSSIDANKRKNNVFLDEIEKDGIVKQTFWNLKLEKSDSMQMEDEKARKDKFLSYEEKQRRKEIEEIARSKNRVDWSEWARNMEDEESEDGEELTQGDEWDLGRQYMLLNPHVAKANVSLVPDGSLDFYEEEEGEDGNIKPSVRDFLRFALED